MSERTATKLNIRIENNLSAGQTLFLAIYDGTNDKGWQSQPVAQLSTLLQNEPELVLTVDLPKGRYAARGFVDLSGDGALNTARSGRPQEPFAISIGDKRSKPSHRFKTAVFTVDAETYSLILTLRYPKSLVTPISASSQPTTTATPSLEGSGSL